MRREKKGFTLVELMITVAILAVLAALAIPAASELQARWRMAELDHSARTISMAVQEQLVARRADGAVPLAAAEEDGRRWVTKDRTGAPEGTEEWLKLLPEGAVEPELLSGCFTICWDPASGGVEQVYYAEQPLPPREQLPATPQERREARIGYYGGGTTQGETFVRLDTPELKLEEKDTSLTLVVTVSPETLRLGVTPVVTVTGQSEGGQSQSNTLQPIGQSGQEYRYLLDSLEENGHFHELAAGRKIVPGSDLKIKAELTPAGRAQLLPAIPAELEVNSLFAARTRNEETGTVTAVIRTPRQLENLGRDGSGVTAAVQQTNLVWPEELEFISIDNESLKTYQGGGHSIDGLRGSNGLFAVSYGMELSGIRLTDPVIDGGSAAAGALVGIAKDGTLITDCRTYLKTARGVPEGDPETVGVRSSAQAGGLVGQGRGKVVIQNSFAALPAVSGTAAGGLVGQGETVELEGCYASVGIHSPGAGEGDFLWSQGLSGTTAGGLIGSAGPDTLVNSCYAVGTTDSAAAVGLCGSAVKQRGCYWFYVLPEGELSCGYVTDGGEVKTADPDDLKKGVTGLSGFYGPKQETETYPYSQACRGSYPFPVLKLVTEGRSIPMPHYGDWPLEQEQKELPRLNIRVAAAFGVKEDGSQRELARNESYPFMMLAKVGGNETLAMELTPQLTPDRTDGTYTWSVKTLLGTAASGEQENNTGPIRLTIPGTHPVELYRIELTYTCTQGTATDYLYLTVRWGEGGEETAPTNAVVLYRNGEPFEGDTLVLEQQAGLLGRSTQARLSAAVENEPDTEVIWYLQGGEGGDLPLPEAGRKLYLPQEGKAAAELSWSSRELGPSHSGTLQIKALDRGAQENVSFTVYAKAAGTGERLRSVTVHIRPKVVLSPGDYVVRLGKHKTETLYISCNRVPETVNGETITPKWSVSDEKGIRYTVDQANPSTCTVTVSGGYGYQTYYVELEYGPYREKAQIRVLPEYWTDVSKPQFDINYDRIYMDEDELQHVFLVEKGETRPLNMSWALNKELKGRLELKTENGAHKVKIAEAEVPKDETDQGAESGKNGVIRYDVTGLDFTSKPVELEWEGKTEHGKEVESDDFGNFQIFVVGGEFVDEASGAAEELFLQSGEQGAVTYRSFFPEQLRDEARVRFETSCEGVVKLSYEGSGAYGINGDEASQDDDDDDDDKLSQDDDDDDDRFSHDDDDDKLSQDDDDDKFSLDDDDWPFPEDRRDRAVWKNEKPVPYWPEKGDGAYLYYFPGGREIDELPIQLQAIGPGSTVLTATYEVRDKYGWSRTYQTSVLVRVEAEEQPELKPSEKPEQKPDNWEESHELRDRFKMEVEFCSDKDVVTLNKLIKAGDFGEKLPTLKEGNPTQWISKGPGGEKVPAVRIDPEQADQGTDVVYLKCRLLYKLWDPIGSESGYLPVSAYRSPLEIAVRPEGGARIARAREVWDSWHYIRVQVARDSQPGTVLRLRLSYQGQVGYEDLIGKVGSLGEHFTKKEVDLVGFRDIHVVGAPKLRLFLDGTDVTDTTVLIRDFDKQTGPRTRYVLEGRTEPLFSGGAGTSGNEVVWTLSPTVEGVTLIPGEKPNTAVVEIRKDPKQRVEVQAWLKAHDGQDHWLEPRLGFTFLPPAAE